MTKNPFEVSIDSIVDRFSSTLAMTIKLTMAANDGEIESLQGRLWEIKALVESLRVELKISTLNRYKNELEGMICKLNGNPGTQETGNPGIRESGNL